MAKTDSSKARRWPDHDPANSMPAGNAVPRIVRADEASGCGGDELLAAATRALDAAIDLVRPGHTAARALTVQTTMAVAVAHPDRRAWALSWLEHLADQWGGERQ
jgi:hypothetical protein